MNPFIEVVSICKDLPQPDPIQNIIVWDLSVDELIEIAKNNHKDFIFPFISLPVEVMHDYSKLKDPRLSEWTCRIHMPMYLGNMQEPEKVAEELVAKWTDTSNIWG